MKQMMRTLDELKLYAGCDSVGIVLTDEDAIFMFIFTQLGVVSKVQVPLTTLYETLLTDPEIETLLLEEIHSKINAFKRSNGMGG